MARRFGIPPATARDQLQKLVTPATTETFRPLPAPTGQAPFRASPAQLGIADATPLPFFVLGDSGGIMNPTPQNNVSNAMQAQPAPAFVYHVGDVIYFNGAEADYPSQFYEPYAHLDVPVVGVPGNHDGDNSNDTQVPSLSAYMANFCATGPDLPARSEEFNRDTETQPNCYWTLRAAAVTIVGLYTNVPSGGVVQSDQAAWLAGELTAAPAGVPLIVALHHPPYSATPSTGARRRWARCWTRRSRPHRGRPTSSCRVTSTTISASPGRSATAPRCPTSSRATAATTTSTGSRPVPSRARRSATASCSRPATTPTGAS